MSVAQAQTENVSQYPQEVSCLLIPMASLPMLLPNVSVAEIITGQIKPNPRTPAWHLGTINWRSVLIPAVSMEVLNNRPLKADSSYFRLAIINSYRGDDRLPFYAIAVDGIPGLVRVMSGDLDAQAEQTLPGESMRVIVGGQKAVIPDLDYIERKLLSDG